MQVAIGKDAEKGYRLYAEMFVKLPIETVFDLFADAFQLEQITPPLLQFSVLTPRPIAMRPGLLIDYKLKLHGIPIRWQSEIPIWEPPHRFVDQQVRGPYKRWYHEHLFEEIDGGTLVKDQVHYIPRGGRLLHHLMVRPDLMKIFQYRQAALKNIFDEMIEKQAQSAIKSRDISTV